MKYYIILKSINGRLLRVFGRNLKREVTAEVNFYIERGYQVTVVEGCVLQTADNLEAERSLVGITKE